MTENTKRVFLIHGFEANPNQHWFPWLKAEIMANHFEVYAPSMPDPAEPKVGEWISMIKEWVGKCDEDTYFVGHSLGCISIIRYLETLKAGERAGGCVLVAGFSSDIELPAIADFCNLPLDFDKVKGKCEKFICVASDNDYAVPLGESLNFAKKLNAKVIVERGKGHFCSSDGVTSLPSISESILNIIN